MGTSLKPNDIKEGDDVYFDCEVKANPKVYRLVWYHNVSAVSPSSFSLSPFSLPGSVRSALQCSMLALLAGRRGEPQSVGGSVPERPQPSAAPRDARLCRALLVPGGKQPGQEQLQRRGPQCAV